MAYIIGVDLDNTIISYDDIMHSLAIERELISPNVEKSKKQIRDTIRQLQDGEIEWQRLQAAVYGPEIRGAKLIHGVQTFFKNCKQCNIKAYIVSHKTVYANIDETGTNLRDAALGWMRENKFFDLDGLGLSQKDVYFETTRNEKNMRIGKLGCTHFIDDLEETFLEESFPQNVQKILYAPHGNYIPLPGVNVFKTWDEINTYFFAE